MDPTVYWSPGMTLDSLEQLVIAKAFKHYHGNKTATANSLGIAIRTLENKLEKYEMEEIEKEEQNAARRTEREFQLARARGINPSTAVSAGVLPKTGEGLRPQSIANVSAQQAVPVSVGVQVQGVLPKSTPQNNPRKSRG